jgi:ABC-type antimicrobial peptide transport system permease subunit
MIFDLRQLFQRLRSSLPSGNLDGELETEIASHIELATEENIRRGMTEQEARRQALVRFGGMEQAKQQQRDARGFFSIDVDPTAYLSMILLLAAVAFVAGYLPARRASRIDPMIALRNN